MDRIKSVSKHSIIPIRSTITRTNIISITNCQELENIGYKGYKLPLGFNVLLLLLLLLLLILLLVSRHLGEGLLQLLRDSLQLLLLPGQLVLQPVHLRVDFSYLLSSRGLSWLHAKALATGSK